MIIRRLDADLRACPSLDNCPALMEDEDGTFLVIGQDVTGEVKDALGAFASCGPDERIIRIPRLTLVSAKCSIPEV